MTALMNCPTAAADSGKGRNSMQFFLLHWHCILPAAAILIGLALTGRDKRAQSKLPADERPPQDSLEEKELWR